MLVMWPPVEPADAMLSHPFDGSTSLPCDNVRVRVTLLEWSILIFGLAYVPLPLSALCSLRRGSRMWSLGRHGIVKFYATPAIAAVSVAILPCSPAMQVNISPSVMLVTARMFGSGVRCILCRVRFTYGRMRLWLCIQVECLNTCVVDLSISCWQSVETRRMRAA